MTASPSDPTKPDRPVVEFDHRSPIMVEKGREILDGLQANCPVAWTEAHGGHWVVTGMPEVMEVARDDDRFSSENDHIKRQGVAIPGLPNWAGMVEMDPPEFSPVRKAFIPWFSLRAAKARIPLVRTIADYCIDRVIESGACDFTEQLSVPIPALLTMQFMGFPFAEAEKMADVFHRHSYVKPGTPERDQLNAEIAELGKIVQSRAAIARRDPGPDFLSFLATVEIDGALLTDEQISGHAFLVLIGGIDTSSSLLSQTFIHLHQDPKAREALIANPELLDSAFDEYLRYFSPVPGLARTITRDCTLGGQTLEQDERLWISWAGANMSPATFEDPAQVKLDRSPNRHVAFGIGIHRCIGANFARVIWMTTMEQILARIPDFAIDVEASIPFPDVGAANGWISTPATFTPGMRVGATLDDHEAGLVNKINQVMAGEDALAR
jgi:cytochrome P450